MNISARQYFITPMICWCFAVCHILHNHLCYHASIEQFPTSGISLLQYLIQCLMTLYFPITTQLYKVVVWFGHAYHIVVYLLNSIQCLVLYCQKYYTKHDLMSSSLCKFRLDGICFSVAQQHDWSATYRNNLNKKKRPVGEHHVTGRALSWRWLNLNIIYHHICFAW